MKAVLVGNRTVWKHLAMICALASLLGLAACSSNEVSSGSDGDANAGDTDAGNTAADDTGATTTVTVTDPAAAELTYRCSGTEFSAADMINATDPVTVGEATIDPVPLDAVLPALMVSQGGEPSQPCVAVRSGIVELRPVAWELIDGQVAIEKCLDASEADVDLRTVGDLEILSVYGPYPDDASDCLVDGTVTLDVAVSDGVRDGLLFPFQTPSAQWAERLGFSQGATALPIDDTTLSCEATTLPGEAGITWSGVEYGLTPKVLAGAGDVGDDAVIFTAETGGIEDSPSILAAANDRRAGKDEPTIGSAASGFSDLQAPADGVRPYRLEVSDRLGNAASVDCGAAGMTDAGLAEQPVVAVGSLSEAAELFNSVAPLPYVYMRLVPTCPGCNGTAVELMLTPVDGVRVFQPSLAEQTDPNQPGLIDPFSLHQFLADAENEGKDVSYVIDPGSGVPFEWSVDGEGAIIECLETDTAPPDLRSAPGCSVAGNVIGS